MKKRKNDDSKTPTMKKRPQLSINVSEINAQQENNASSDALLLESTYRAEGLSIGKDYMRFEGSMLESSPSPEDFVMEEIIGQGVSSIVKRARLSPTSSLRLRGEGDGDCDGGLNTTAKQQYFALKICPLNKEANRSSVMTLSQQENTTDPPTSHQQKEQNQQNQRHVHTHRAMFLQEMKTLCRIQCDSLVSLIGGFYEPGISVTMVLEYMDRGSLADLMLRVASKSSAVLGGSDEIECTSTSVIGEERFKETIPEFALSSIAYQMLLGISYLHSENVIHRDLKPGMFYTTFISHYVW